MHWFEHLSILYGSNDGPLYHVLIYTDIEILLDNYGKFKKAVPARLLTQIPVTDSSLNRTSAISPHPLSDKLRYVARGYSKLHHDAYLKQLDDWAASEWSTARLRAVSNYIHAETLADDLSHITSDQNSAVRFVVDDVPLWQDEALISAHIHRINADISNVGFCCITGECTPLCDSHQKRIISPLSSAKLISHEHRNRIIHQGRFNSIADVFSVGRELSFKAHTVLRRLITENSITIGNRVFVAWDDFSSTPLPFSCTAPEPRGNVTVLGFTEPTKGRLSVTFLRYISAELYSERVHKWHSLDISAMDISDAAFGHHGKNGQICSREVYGHTAERLLGCILGDTILPYDIMYALRTKAPSMLERLQKYITGEIYEHTGL